MHNFNPKDDMENVASAESASYEQTSELMELALQCTEGDADKARSMVNGTYFDNTVLKGTFLLQDFGHSGVFIIFFNIEKDYISFMDMVTVKSPIIYEQLDASGDWKTLSREINTLKNEAGSLDTTDRRDTIIREMIEMNFFDSVKGGEINRLEFDMEMVLRKVLGNQHTSCKLSLAPVSSLSMLQEGIPFEKPETSFIINKVDAELENNPELTEQIANVEKDAEYIIDGSIVVSPVKGKSLLEVAVGDKIMVNLTGNDVVTQKVLKVLGAIDSERKISPVQGKVVEKFTLSDSGSIILYVLVAKKVMAKIIEESNVKISVLDTGESDDNNASEGWVKLPLPVVVFLALFCLAAVFFLLR